MASRDLFAAMRERGADPDRLALVTRGTSHTVAGLEVEAHQYAERLRSEGARPGRIHPFVVEPDEEGVLTLLGLWLLGAIPAPLNPRLTDVERDRAEADLRGREGGGAQVVLWTSGTAGRPRGVALSFESLLASADASRRRLDLDPSDQWLATLSLAHVGGLALMVRAFLLEAGLVAYGAVQVEEISSLVDGPEGLPVGVNTPVTHLSLVPTQLLRLLEHRGDRPPPATFRCLLLGGAHTPRALLDRALAAGWPVALTYGMTEMASQVATASPDAVRRKPGTVGRALEGVELRVTQDGEILVRGSTQALGYVGHEAPLVDAQGWYHTGDLGELDEDGDLWITGRLSDRIVSGGVNVDPTEVEEALRAHPAVMDVCVAGVPDDEWGEVVVAWVVPVEGEFDLDDVEGWLRQRLAGPKRPRRWVVDTELPLNANGKVDRALVQELMQD